MNFGLQELLRLITNTNTTLNITLNYGPRCSKDATKF
jgi:hypothetical protein